MASFAVADATVVDVRDEETVTGIATANLFRWNSVMLKVDTKGKENDEGGDLYVEYVHVAAKSAIVAVGDVVRRGQKICESGSVGFSPEPHLHFTAFRSRDPAAPTVRVRFAAEERDGGRDGGRRRSTSDGESNATELERQKLTTFLPVAGRWYDAFGEAPAPEV